MGFKPHVSVNVLVSLENSGLRTQNVFNTREAEMQAEYKIKL